MLERAFRKFGSGMVEPACKTVAGQRLKESGMHWEEPGTLSQLRSLYKPKLWETTGTEPLLVIRTFETHTF